jgi:hypothetical protein
MVLMDSETTPLTTIVHNFLSLPYVYFGLASRPRSVRSLTSALAKCGCEQRYHYSVQGGIIYVRQYRKQVLPCSLTLQLQAQTEPLSSTHKLVLRLPRQTGGLLTRQPTTT